jgi:phage-related protein
MIKNVFVNGIRVNNDRTFLQKLGNIASAGVEFSDYQRGGASGQILSRPLYRGMTINMQWFVKGNDLNDFIGQRDRLVTYFQNLDTDENYLKTLGFELNNGITKNIDVLFTTIQGDLNPGDIAHSVFTVSAVSEKEFLTSSYIKRATLSIFNAGGMAVPMPVPMSMANNPSGELSVIINNGNAIAYPTFRVHGTFSTSFSLVNDTTNKTISFVGALGANDYIDLDFYNRTAIKNSNQSVLGSLIGDWWTLAIGTNQIRLTGSDQDDTGTADIEFSDTYRNI